MSRSIRDYSYEELLDRAYSKLSTKPTSTSGFIMPKIDLIFVGDKTIIMNFRQIVEAINREAGILQKYFSKELGSPATLNESGQLVLQGRFNVQVLTKLLKIFIDRYVICPTCSSKDTKLVKKGKVFLLKCMACGAETTLGSF
ncbi:MAG: translation initiation factor IF-2 subunit beta [Desulfurococcaceae archaeon]|uniref:Translation initiation factor 2 subunit beta n=1 Tax=Staphylothermus marinus TaxID=2280 RepID=A0A7C4H8X0_STAMA